MKMISYTTVLLLFAIGSAQGQQAKQSAGAELGWWNSTQAAQQPPAHSRPIQLVVAQQSAQQKTPATSQRGTAQLDPSSMLAQAVERVLQLLDQGKAEEVWDGASTMIKPMVPKVSFVAGIRQDRAALGEVRQRNLVDVQNYRVDEGTKAPPGQYISVFYATRYARNEKPIRELVSFRLDEDGMWRVSGYTVR